MSGETRNDIWPPPKFSFSVQFGDDKSIAFQEVTGPESETNIIEYRNGNSPSFYPTSFYPTKIPGLGRVGNVTMRKGIFVNDEKFWKWYNEINLNTIARRTVIINLLDETANPELVWTLNNASPTKITGIDLVSEGDEVAVELIEVAFETMTVAAP